MASSKIMASASPVNSDLPRKQSVPVADLRIDQSNASALGSMNMDELLKNFYGADSGSFLSDNVGGGAAVGAGGLETRTADEVWREIMSGGAGNDGVPHMTLEDFLTKAGAVTEDDVRVSAMLPPRVSGFGVDVMMADAAQYQASVHMQPVQHGPTGDFGNGMNESVMATGMAGGGGAGRGKKRMIVVEERPLDKATQQKQRRMIKNRESAARSRERKQAYTIELESLVTQLEEENARLLREEAQQNKEKYKQLMKNLIPVAEKRKPCRALRRVNSMFW